MADKHEEVCRALCESGQYETGQGACSTRCLETIGVPRGGPYGCPYKTLIHGKAAYAALDALGVVSG